MLFFEVGYVVRWVLLCGGLYCVVLCGGLCCVLWLVMMCSFILLVVFSKISYNYSAHKFTSNWFENHEIGFNKVD